MNTMPAYSGTGVRGDDFCVSLTQGPTELSQDPEGPGESYHQRPRNGGPAHQRLPGPWPVPTEAPGHAGRALRSGLCSLEFDRWKQ
jgi:hypothetical protein